MSSTVADTVGFTSDRFGMFIHFGLYSVAGRHEWVKNRERLTDEQYQPYFERFDPDLFDAREIAAMARQAGARYVVLTTKHHDGFCLWDSNLTDYTSVAATGRDLVAEYVAAVRAEGLKVGFYHSVIDWHHPDFTVDRFHPLRGGDLTALNAGRDMSRYRAYLHGQVRELLSGYGKIDVLFYDFTYPGEVDGLPGKGPQDWDAETLLALTRELQPGIVVNDRLGISADYTTPEQFQPTSPVTDRDGNLVVWEVCHTINGSWGYDRANLAYKAPELLVQMLITSVANGGNMILNVGPTGRGSIDPRDAAAFRAVGDWMRLHGRSIHGCGPADFAPPANCVYTKRDNRLYVHLLAWPLHHLHLPGLAGKVRFAQLLNDGAEVAVERHAGDGTSPIDPPGQAPDTVTIRLPVVRPDVLVPVVELFLDD